MDTSAGHGQVSEDRASMEYQDNVRCEALYRAYGRHVYAYCCRRTSMDEAKDATADVFVVVLRRINTVPDGDGALPWLYGVARNVLANRSRSQRRRVRLTVKIAGRYEGSVPGPEPQIVRNEEYEELIGALSKLSDKDQEILRLVEWEGLSREQVADMFFVSRAAIDKR
ncbi:MAG: sigma-70 family RNA polymerase sigma factor, partial [Actinomycetia bacterium]|nr:sigma-70 family RNA polymerase sigma factor [Actinomycetes bacterium]